MCFSEFDLFFPPLDGVELFVIFPEVEASIVETFGKVFVRDIFAGFIELLLAFVEFFHFLVKSGEDDVFSN